MVKLAHGFQEGKEDKLTSIIQFPPQQTIITFLIATADKK